MIALQINDIKSFMGKFLGTDAFDSFLLEEAAISTYNTFLIDGHMNKEFFTQEDWEDPAVRPYDFSPWSSMRRLCFDLIKGKRTPHSFRIILHLKPELVARVLEGGDTQTSAEQIKGLILTCRFDDSGLTLVTGTSFVTFIMDKTPDIIWDKAICVFLDKKGIGYEKL